MKVVIGTSISNLRIRTESIKVGTKTNSYDIRRIKNGDLRMGVKLLDGALINDHNVYVIINPSFGGRAGKAKQDGFESNVHIWEKESERVEELTRILSKNNNQNGVSDEAKKELLDAIKYYIEIKSNQNDELVQGTGGEEYGSESRKTLG